MADQSLRNPHIKKRLVLLLLILSLVFPISRGITAQTTESKKSGKPPVSKGATRYAYDNGIRKVIQEAPDELMVFFEPAAKVGRQKADELIKNSLGQNAVVTKYNSFTALVTGPADITIRANAVKLKNKPEIKAVSPVYYEGEKTEFNRRGLTGEIIAHFYLPQDERSLRTLAKQYGFNLEAKSAFSKNTYYFSTDMAIDSLAIANKLQSLEAVKFAYPNWYKTMTEKATPNDPLYPGQWHLKNTGQGGGTAGNDVNIEPVWDNNRGSSNEVIAIVDDGVEIAHEDLAANMLNAYNWDWVGNDSNPSPSGDDNHGTAVAGVAAARGFNSLGVTGAAPEAGIAGYRLLGAETDVNEANAMIRNKDIIDISSNSWGPYDDARRLEGPGPLTEAAFIDGVTNGRQGKGIVYVWAGGNGFAFNDNSNYDGYANSRFTIGVGASTNSGLRSSYSEKGANLLVNAPSSGGSLGITTTDRTGVQGYDSSSYFNDFGGTSSATPLVSGVIALILKTNPNLTWRDVQQILIKSAYKNDPTNSDWTTNGSGFNINHAYGFGRINAEAAVNLAAAWTNVEAETSVQNSSNPNLPIPDDNSAGVSNAINITGDLEVEHVDIVFSASNHTYWGDLEIILESPAGTRSILSEEHVSGWTSGYNNWRFGSVRHFGESSQGQWKLTVKDLAAEDTGTFQSWQLKIYGTGQISVPDTTEPVTSLAVTPSSPNGNLGWYKSKPSISLASNETGATFYSWTSASGPWIEYEGSLAAPEGAKTLYYYSVDAAGNAESPPKSRTFKVDSKKPVSTLTAPVYSTNTSATSNFKISWSGNDPLPSSGIANYDVEYKTGAGGSRVRFKTSTTLKAGAFTGVPGKTYYFTARTRDKAGNTGNWSPMKAVIIPFDQNVLEFSNGWPALINSSLFKGSSRYSTSKNSSSKYKFTKALNVGVLVTKRRNAGYADVYIGAAKVKTINLYSATTRYRVPVLIKSYTSPASGTLKVVVKRTKSSSSSGTRVEIDGVFAKK